MNLQEIMNQITTLGGQIRQKAMDLNKAAADNGVDVSTVEKMQAELADMNARMAALRATYDVMEGAQASGLTAAQPKAAEQPRSVREMRQSNEYARAFAYAVKHGLNPRNGMGNEHVKVLFDALTETGGNPAGADGGFLVPIDIDNQIKELRRQLNPLADHFGVEYVTSLTGWRVVDTAPTAGMTAVNEMGNIPTDDQPVFAKVPYTLAKYALRVPVSNELLSDEVANLMGYLSRWFARKQVLTENGLILAALKTLTASALTTANTDALQGLKTALNKALDPAISAGAIILTNQSGFDALDQLTDDNGRGLLQPDPTNPTIYRVYGRRVVMLSDAELPNTVVSTKNNAEFFIGDGREFATLFSRDGLEVASTDVGGNAWITDSTEVRGIARMCVSKFDAAAMVRRQLEL